MCLRDRELYALICANRSTEHHPLRGIAGGALDKPPPVADGLRGDQDPLGIHTVEDVAEAAALGSNQVIRRNLQVLDEQLGGVVIEHRLDRTDLNLLAS